MSDNTHQEAVRLTKEQIMLSTLVADALMDKTPTRSIADRADVIVRRMLNEPDVVVRAIDPDPYGLIELMADCEEELRDARGRLYEYTGQLARLSEQLAAERALCDRLRAIHTPFKTEIEVWHDDEPCPEPDARGCPGHFRTIECCANCGRDDDGERVWYHEWPCESVRLLDAHRELCPGCGHPRHIGWCWCDCLDDRTGTDEARA